MSHLGVNGIGNVNLAGSFAGAQRTDANSDRDKAEAAVQKRQSDKKSAADSVDIAHSEHTADRDADGWFMYEQKGEPNETQEDAAAVESSSDPPIEPSNQLDLRA